MPKNDKKNYFTLIDNEGNKKECKILYTFDNTEQESNTITITSDQSYPDGMKISAKVVDMSGKEPERFYHGFILGLIVDLKGRYTIESNRESGFGRYDVMLIPINKNNPGIIIEFKSISYDDGEKDLLDTVNAALQQIEDKHYVTALVARGLAQERLFTYGFAFKGKEVLIAGGPAYRSCPAAGASPSSAGSSPAGA